MIEPLRINTEDYNYNLPQEKIASYPNKIRDNSLLLLYENNKISHTSFYNLHEYLSPNSLMIFNNSKVINARLFFIKDSGAGIEIFCLEPSDPSEYHSSLSATNQCAWKCLVGNNKKWKHGSLSKKIIIGHEETILYAEKNRVQEGSFIINFRWENSNISFSEILEKYGNVPIPPYLNRKSEELDKERYQTVYAQNSGSVAAPTAGLHFTEDVFGKLASKNISIENITLHVGAGTFQPVKNENALEHKMHPEKFSVSFSAINSIINNLNNNTVVGTTSLRCLESLYPIAIQIIEQRNNPGDRFFVGQWEAYEDDNKPDIRESLSAISAYIKRNSFRPINCETQLMIVPGFKFKIAKNLITNFHQPKSTLLLLVAAFTGNNWKNIYEYALMNNFRFLSYGDSMLIKG